MLELNYQTALLEAGLDEAGRGCYAGPVFAAAVILPPNFYHPLLNDSKKLIFIQLIIVVFVFSSCLTFYNTLRPNTIAISNEASAKEEQNDLETLEELENIEIEN